MTPAQPIQVNRSTDTSQMTERLRRITHLFTRDSHFFREHAQVVRVGEDIVEVGERQLAEVRDVDVVGCRLLSLVSRCLCEDMGGEGGRGHTRAMASTSQNVTMIKAPSRPPTPSLAFLWSYRKTIRELERPSFSGAWRIFLSVLMKRGSLGGRKKTRGAIKIDASRTSGLSKLWEKWPRSELYPLSMISS